jgi:hypothetical protein
LYTKLNFKQLIGISRDKIKEVWKQKHSNLFRVHRQNDKGELSAVNSHTIKTSNSSIALNGDSVISWRANAKHKVEKDRSPPIYQKINGHRTKRKL